MDNESVEFDFHENLDQFYPGLRRDTHKEDGLVEGDKSIIFHPNEGFYSKYGKIATRDWRGKRCKFFKNNDPRVNINLNFSDATFRSMDTLISKLSEKLSDDMPFGVRSIHTPKTGTEIRSLQDLQHGRAYVCREVNKPRALNLSKVQNMQIENWTNKKPLTSQEDHSLRISGKYLDGWWFEQKMKSGRSSSESKQMGFKPRSPKDEEEMLERTPKKLTVYRNGCWLERHLVLLNKRLKFRPAEESFRGLLQDIGEMFGMKFVRLVYGDEPYTEVRTVRDVLEGPDVFIALQHLEALLKPTATLEPIGRPIQKNVNIDPLMVDKSGVVRKGKSLGRWRLKVITSDEEEAGTTANITLWVYGDKRDSGPISLERQSQDSFSAGSVEEIDIKTGKLGAIYKIRLEHDNAGSSPSWKCTEVMMTDVNTERSLVFPIDRWMSLDHEDGSTSREVSMLKKNGDAIHPTIIYEVLITTGDCWGAGTNVQPFITLIGERGDSGQRTLLHSQAKLKQTSGTRAKYKPFKKHQVDLFNIEAVSLGRLKKIRIGHDNTKPGDGWFLDKVVVHVSDSREGETKSFNFPCSGWLDIGQDDGKIVREIFASEHHTGIDGQKAVWEIEQWKYERGNELVFVSEASGKALQIKGDATYNATGDPQDPFCVMVVKAKLNGGIRVFRSGLHSGYHLGIDKGKVWAEMRGGAHCEFKVVQQKDRAICLQSIRNPTQYVTFNSQGQPSMVSSPIKAELRFRVYCRGAFRDQGVIIIQTSPTQTLFVDDENKVVGFGTRDVGSYFRVIKIQTGVRVFQSVSKPDCFIQIKDGAVDGSGDGGESCYFFVERSRNEGGSFRLLSMTENTYLGLTPEGVGTAASEEDIEDLVFYAEVIQFGNPKPKRPDFKSSLTTPRTWRIETPKTTGGGSTHRSHVPQQTSRSQVSRKSTTDPKTPTVQENTTPGQAEEQPKTPSGNQPPISEEKEEPKSPELLGEDEDANPPESTEPSGNQPPISEEKEEPKSPELLGEDEDANPPESTEPSGNQPPISEEKEEPKSPELLGEDEDTNLPEPTDESPAKSPEIVASPDRSPGGQ